MKKLFTKSLLLLAGLGIGATAMADNSVNVTFNGTDHVNGTNSLRVTNGKNNNDNVVSNSINANGIGIQDGKLVVNMPLQNGQTAQWRGDLQFGESWNANKGVFAEFNKDDKYIAIKFLGPMPVSTIGFEFSVRTGESGSYTYNTYSINNQSTKVTTAAGNTIVYISLAGCTSKVNDVTTNYAIPTDESTKTITYLSFKIAGCTFQTTYKIDWIKTFSAVPTAEQCAVADDGKSPDAEGTQANDYDELPIYDETNGKYFANFNTALAQTNNAYTNISINDVLVLNSDVTLSARNIMNGLTIKGADDKIIVIRRSAAGYNSDFLVNTNNSTISAGTNGTLIYDGMMNATKYSNFEINKSPEFKNVIFQNLRSNKGNDWKDASVFDIKTANMNITFNNCTFKNCYGTTTGRSTNDGDQECVVFCRNNNNKVTLVGNNDFTQCTCPAIMLNTGSYVDASKMKNQASTIILTTEAAATGTDLVKNSTDMTAFRLSKKYMIASDGTNLETANAYTLNVSDAGAATLCLPYNATIPSGVKCYTLSYTSGNTANATEVTGTLPANTPVYVKADAGTYNFAMAEGAAISYAAATSGALTGVYTKTNVPADSYILYNGTSGVGFYKSNNSTVAPFRAYLTVEGSSAKSISIVFDNEATGIKTVNSEQVNNGKAVKFMKNGQLVIKTANGTFNAAGQLVK